MYLFQRTRSGCIGLAGLVAVTLASPAAVRAQQVVVPPAAEAVVPPGAQLLMSRIQAGLALDRYLELLRNFFSRSTPMLMARSRNATSTFTC